MNTPLNATTERMCFCTQQRYSLNVIISNHRPFRIVGSFEFQAIPSRCVGGGGVRRPINLTSCQNVSNKGNCEDKENCSNKVLVSRVMVSAKAERLHKCNRRMDSKEWVAKTTVTEGVAIRVL